MAGQVSARVPEQFQPAQVSAQEPSQSLPEAEEASLHTESEAWSPRRPRPRPRCVAGAGDAETALCSIGAPDSQIDPGLDATAGIRGLLMKMSLERARFFRECDVLR